MTIKSELLAIQQANKANILHCAEAVQWARDNPDSALYGAIEWNNRRAADAYRLAQVRQLIEVHIVHASNGPTVISLTIDRVRGGGYRAIGDVLAVPDLREIMLQDAINDLERMRLRYERVSELAEVWVAAEAAKAKAGKRRSRTLVTA